VLTTERRANTAGLGLDTIGIAQENGRIVVDEYCATSIHGVYAMGDCLRGIGWAHQAGAEGTMVAEIIMKHPTTINLRHVPSCYYAYPQIATIGWTREQAKTAGRRTRTGVFHFRDNARAIAASDHEGFVKVVIDDESGQLLGCQIIGPCATELINEAVLALKTRQTVEELVGSMHVFPTFGEALPAAALAALFSMVDGI